MIPDVPELAVTAEEAEHGFALQALAYPSGALELSGLESGSVAYEKEVALWLDEACRVRRRRSAPGYSCERFDGAVWAVVEEFETLADFSASPFYSRYAQARATELMPASEEQSE